MGTWTALTNQPTFNASTMLLLTDGTVMCQAEGAASWWRLTPDRPATCTARGQHWPHAQLPGVLRLGGAARRKGGGGRR